MCNFGIFMFLAIILYNLIFFIYNYKKTKRKVSNMTKSNKIATFFKEISLLFQPLVIGIFIDLIVNITSMIFSGYGVPFPFFSLISMFICSYNIIKFVYKEYDIVISVILLPFILPVVVVLTIFLPYFLIVNIIHIYNKLKK